MDESGNQNDVLTGKLFSRLNLMNKLYIWVSFLRNLKDVEVTFVGA